jgi:predicted  nucleic acid-binding Zn-ribbon protein
MASDLSIALSQLHALLLELAEAEAAFSDGPRSITVAEKLVGQMEQQIEDQKAKIKLTRKTADELNLKLKTKEAELKKYEGQLNTATSNKEFDIVKVQIANVRTEQGGIENAAFEAMEEIDATQVALKTLETELKNRKQAAVKIKGEVEAGKPALEVTLQNLKAQIEVAEKVIPPGEGLSAYRRLRIANGPGALAGIEDDFCDGCNCKVTNQDLVRIRTGEFMRCRECNRGLYVV